MPRANPNYMRIRRHFHGFGALSPQANPRQLSGNERRLKLPSRKEKVLRERRIERNPPAAIKVKFTSIEGGL
ncbi:MAG: hypothetical protein OXQ99_05710 [Chloroflexota bacterium]|nr:hypothetical protein [Chloroflexota bacterium]